MCVDDRKYFFSPVCHVHFLELSFRVADAYAITDSILVFLHLRDRTAVAIRFPGLELFTSDGANPIAR